MCSISEPVSISSRIILMNMKKDITVSKIWLILSIVNAGLVTLTSLLGIFNPAIYRQETGNWALQAVGQDIANLVVVPILLISTYFLSKGSVKAYLVWLGVYFYLVYSFAIYTFSVHFNILFLAYVAILSISVYAPIGSILGKTKALSQSFPSSINVKPASILLMVIGVLFSVLWLSEIIPHIFSGTRPQSLIETGLWTNPVHVLDLGILLPAMMITSVFLWKKKYVGYLLTVPLLIFSATMGIGILVLFALQAINEGTTVAPPAYLIGLIVILSIYFSLRFINNMND